MYFYKKKLTFMNSIGSKLYDYINYLYKTTIDFVTTNYIVIRIGI